MSDSTSPVPADVKLFVLEETRKLEANISDLKNTVDALNQRLESWRRIATYIIPSFVAIVAAAFGYNLYQLNEVTHSHEAEAALAQLNVSVVSAADAYQKIQGYEINAKAFASNPDQFIKNGDILRLKNITANSYLRVGTLTAVPEGEKTPDTRMAWGDSESLNPASMETWIVDKQPGK